MLTPISIKAPLRECGYRPDLLRTDVSFGNNQTAPLVAFAQSPADSRSACVAVLSAASGPKAVVEACRPLGSPLVFVCFQDTLQWWKQGTKSAEFLESIPAKDVKRFFENNLEKLKPEAVYRAKTWGRFQQKYQLSFVDLGLLPLVEEQVGKSLGHLIEQNVAELKNSVGWGEVSNEQGHWLLQTVFWLVSGKILRDKQVERFQDLNLSDVEDVFQRLGEHYGTEPLGAGSKKKLDGLRGVARIIDRYSSLALTTTESLAYVYENTLISQATRMSLGTHRTPSFLVDYVVGNLTDWIEEIPVNERSVFEPACGHATFLVSAMRLLTELLPPEKRTPGRRGPYLRDRLHGTDIDPFALELARLSLTLTDIPNPDGWDLRVQDMFLGNHLAAQAKMSTILLANPPFDKFKPHEQSPESRFVNKSAEMLWRTLPHLPEGGVFGVVLPQSVLHSVNARGLREFLANKCELREVSLFPDKVFSFSDAESTVLVGRRKLAGGQNEVRYRRIREGDLDRFKSDYTASTTRAVCQSRFSQDASFSLRLPELEEVWDAFTDNPILGDVALIGQGLFYRGADLPTGSMTFSEERFDGSESGFALFDRNLKLHDLPKLYWMNLDPAVIRRAVRGATVGSQQVLLNYAPAGRGPWRLKALVDRQGHPVTSRFIAIRPTTPSYSIEVLWALLNSPVANAYAYSHLGKRENPVGDIRKIPVPKTSSLGAVERAAREYLSAASRPIAATKLATLLLRVDSEVLKSYALPLDLEQRVLGLFTGRRRVGVVFTQTRYLPEELDGRIHFSDFLRFEEDWSVTNRERGLLIDKGISGQLNAEERRRLEALQTYADYHLERVAPGPTHLLDELENRLFSGSRTKGKNVG